MATKTTRAADKGTEPTLPGSGFPNEINTTAEADSAPQVTTDVASLGDPRSDMPRPPTGLVGMDSRDTVAQITVLMQSAVMSSRVHASVWEAGINAMSLVRTASLHPLVAAYKAEALDYLRGQQAKAKEQP